MKSHNMAIFMLLFFCSSISAMEQQPKQVPATAVAISKPVNIAEITTIMQAIDLDDPVILPADLPPLPSIYLVSKQDRSGYAINSHAIPYSGFLTSFIDFQTAQELQQDSTKKKNRIKHIVINLSGKQLSAMVQLLQFLYNHRLEILSYEEIQNYIRHSTNNFSTITFAQLYETIRYFIIPSYLLQALVSMQQPLLLPTNRQEEVAYNQQLAGVFRIAAQSRRNEDGSVGVGDRALWQLFGRMLYPNCLQYTEVEQMVNDIAQQKAVEQIALDALMQSHPELYERHQTILRGHTNAVYTVAFSPDGRMLASGSDFIIRLWNLADSSSRGLSGHTSSVNSVAFSPDGGMLASGSKDKTIRLWNLADGSSRKLGGHTDWVDSIAFSPDGRMLASGSHDKTIRLWNVADGSSRDLRGHAGYVHSIAFSPDGGMLASGSQDKTIRLWNITDGSSREVGRHADEVWSVAFSPDGRTLASGSKDKTIRLWNAADGLLLRELRGCKDYWFNSVAFSPDSTMLASGPWDKTIRIWNVADSSSGELKGHADIVFSVAFSPNGRMLASGSHDKTIRLWGLFASLREALVALRGGCRDI